jgi:NADH-quinone oxidoreductase subunit C
MPDESKEPESVSPPAKGAQTPEAAPVSEKSEVTRAASQATPAEAKSAPAPTSATAEAKPAEAAKAGDPAKPAAPVAAKPPAPPATAAAAANPAASAAAAKPAVPPKPEGPKPEPWESEMVNLLKQEHGSGIVEAVSYLGQKYMTVDSSILPEILRRMHDDEGFDYCVDITAVHYPKREQQFDIVYVLYSFPKNERIRVKSRIAEGEMLQSAFSIWPTADWLEREVFDMFGITFIGHPGLKRILLPEDWKGHPLRKDYGIYQQDQEWVKINLGIESGQ